MSSSDKNKQMKRLEENENTKCALSDFIERKNVYSSDVTDLMSHVNRLQISSFLKGNQSLRFS